LSEEPNTKFVIVGGGNREHLERYVRWSGLQDKVLFTGFMANRSLHQLYRCADVAVFPSLYEPFGIVALEGMAAGAAVVSSDAGGLREVVLHEETGYTSFAGDPGSLAWAILRALRDPVRVEQMKVRARARLQTDFDWGRIADQTLDVYHRVWDEFLHSYWTEKTLWPVVPGAEERAQALKVAEKARDGGYVARPLPAGGMSQAVDPDELLRSVPDLDPEG
ncbi:MAG: glycosyltransferase family 4 protein, partial [Fimbriimonadaceae bacterium]|nr:glycosyltransferase family 4 protein [Fimbriimonadaceae bacterium]